METVEALLMVSAPLLMLRVDPAVVKRPSMVEEMVVKLTVSATPIRTSSVDKGTRAGLQFVAVLQLPKLAPTH